MTWTFAYGSLMFRPSFEPRARETCVAYGFERRFWQGSTDHRGVPGSPGRVVTLVQRPGAKLTGLALQISAHERAQVLAYLDHRERGGYERWLTPLYRTDGSLITDEALAYVATPDNPDWLGEAPLHELVATIRHAQGPSGKNLDYVLALARALLDLESVDTHVFEIADQLDPCWRGSGAQRPSS